MGAACQSHININARAEGLPAVYWIEIINVIHSMWHRFECCGWSVYSPSLFSSVGRPLMRWCGLIPGSSSLHVEVSSGYTQNLKLLYLWWISVFEAWKYCGMLQIKSAISLLMSSLAPCLTASVIRVWMWMGECGMCLKRCEQMIVEEKTLNTVYLPFHSH